MGCQEEEGGEERKLGLEVDPTVVRAAWGVRRRRVGKRES
jgi:hypothetical protein